MACYNYLLYLAFCFASAFSFLLVQVVNLIKEGTEWNGAEWSRVEFNRGNGRGSKAPPLKVSVATSKQ